MLTSRTIFHTVLELSCRKCGVEAATSRHIADSLRKFMEKDRKNENEQF